MRMEPCPPLIWVKDAKRGLVWSSAQEPAGSRAPMSILESSEAPAKTDWHAVAARFDRERLRAFQDALPGGEV